MHNRKIIEDLIDDIDNNPLSEKQIDETLKELENNNNHIVTDTDIKRNRILAKDIISSLEEQEKIENRKYSIFDRIKIVFGFNI